MHSTDTDEEHTDGEGLIFPFGDVLALAVIIGGSIWHYMNWGS